MRRDVAATHVDGDEHLLWLVGVQNLPQQPGIGEGGGSENHTRGARGECVLHRLGRAQPAAVLNGHVQLGDLAQVLQVDRLARPGAVEVNHMQSVRARLDPGASRGQRVLVVDLLGVEVALQEAHGAAAEYVDRRIELHLATGTRAVAQMAVKLASRRRPAAEDFSGWNCTP